MSSRVSIPKNSEQRFIYLLYGVREKNDNEYGSFIPKIYSYPDGLPDRLELFPTEGSWNLFPL